MGRPIKDLTGQRFGRLTAIKFMGTNKRGRAEWLCRCDCGTEKVINASNLGNGNTVSCGCLREENRRKLPMSHGESRTRLYKIWSGMISRCCNPNAHEYENYGGRGVKVCDEWRKYEPFRDWAMANGFDKTATKKECTLDRVDVNGDYEPSNCRWVDMKTQNRNTRGNVLITYKGETHCMSEWAEIAGLKYITFQHRLYAGWSMEEAMNTPLLYTR